VPGNWARLAAHGELPSGRFQLMGGGRMASYVAPIPRIVSSPLHVRAAADQEAAVDESEAVCTPRVHVLCVEGRLAS
jgi:hypothetical protein